jgi:adhesin/invasin
MGARARCAATVALVVLCAALGWWLNAPTAAAAGPASTVAVSLSPASIVANGSSKSTATATVKDAAGHLLSKHHVTITSTDSGETISGVTDHQNGTYTATIRSSTSVGSAKITATDTSSPPVSGTATLYQTSASVSLQVSPSSILANGSSTSTAVATVTDANNKPLKNQAVAFSSDDPGETFGPVTAGTGSAAGTYAATITSSTTADTATITATDTTLAPPPTGQATLTQTPNPSTTALTSVPTAPVTNQLVTLIATVTSSAGVAPPTGTVAFNDGAAPIGACAAVPVATLNQSATVTCQTPFSAVTPPEQLIAVFTPTAGSNISGSTSATDPLAVGRDSSSTTLTVPAATVRVGAKVTYSAAVVPGSPGPFAPTGLVAFVDGKTPIGSCAAQPLALTGTATCTLTYKSPGTHQISAVYAGDANFSGSGSSTQRVKASRPVLGTISSLMQWTFFYTPSYTKVLALVVNGAPVGAAVLVQCHGRGCPFANRAITVARSKPCKPKAKHCKPIKSRTINLIAQFPHLRNQHLRVGAQVLVKIVRSRWIGKYYAFVIRPRRAPRIKIACLAPGASRPGVGC